jgi:hypothetical protein
MIKPDKTRPLSFVVLFLCDLGINVGGPVGCKNFLCYSPRFHAVGWQRRGIDLIQLAIKARFVIPRAFMHLVGNSERSV